MVVAVLLVALVVLPGWRDDRHALAEGNPPSQYQRFEMDVRDAGFFLAGRMADGETVSSCFGWVAYPVWRHPHDDTCGLNSREEVDRTTWFVTNGFPFDVGATPPPDNGDYRPVASFGRACAADPAWSWYTVFVLEGSDADARTPERVAVPPGCG